MRTVIEKSQQKLALQLLEVSEPRSIGWCGWGQQIIITAKMKKSFTQKLSSYKSSKSIDLYGLRKA